MPCGVCGVVEAICFLIEDRAVFSVHVEEAFVGFVEVVGFPDLVGVCEGFLRRGFGELLYELFVRFRLAVVALWLRPCESVRRACFAVFAFSYFLGFWRLRDSFVARLS